MRQITDEKWNSMWSEKIITAQQILMVNGDKNMAKIFHMMHEMGDRSGQHSVRHSLIKAMRDMVRNNAKYGNEVCYTLGGRYRLPYEVRTIVYNMADQANRQARTLHLELSKESQLISMRTRSRWIYAKGGGDYKIKETMMKDEWFHGRQAYNKMKTTLTHWFKIGVWDGTQDMLNKGMENPDFFVARINEITNQEVTD